MNDQYLESSKFYSYKFHNFSTMIILPAFILVILLFIGSFFAVHENVINSIGVVEPDHIVSLKNNGLKLPTRKIACFIVILRVLTNIKGTS
ncbi:hypothetical protein L2477_11845, partial [Lactobacillus crispatus]|nr:hypothetical protein [Lactobacillus crispatus]MCZ3578112.1 hypothetical protein [Lactobacillus crispatus]MCZ3597434.1 hypothetical protein [Lactobacillus crispatus]MCZ3847788.1 hypothetical protein [Lactobacillus crispatus]MCZ3850059.1 hypothetical protein [Lactobacillus crispatus]